MEKDSRRDNLHGGFARSRCHSFLVCIFSANSLVRLLLSIRKSSEQGILCGTNSHCGSMRHLRRHCGWMQRLIVD